MAQPDPALRCVRCDRFHGDTLPCTVATDAVLHSLHIANLSRAIADGDLAANVQLGVVFARFITEGLE